MRNLMAREKHTNKKAAYLLPEFNWGLKEELKGRKQVKLKESFFLTCCVVFMLVKPVVPYWTWHFLPQLRYTAR